MVKDKKVQKDLQEIKKRLDAIKEKTGEIKMILPIGPGKNIKSNFNKINKILDGMLEE